MSNMFHNYLAVLIMVNVGVMLTFASSKQSTEPPGRWVVVAVTAVNTVAFVLLW